VGVTLKLCAEFKHILRRCSGVC